MIGKQWRDEPDEVKDKYREDAQLVKEEHEARYPGYKYRPRRNPKGSGKGPIQSVARGRKKDEQELLAAPRRVESPTVQLEKEEESDIKPPTEAGVTALRGCMFANRC